MAQMPPGPRRQRWPAAEAGSGHQAARVAAVRAGATGQRVCHAQRPVSHTHNHESPPLTFRDKGRLKSLTCAQWAETLIVNVMDTALLNRAETIRARLLRLRDSL